MNSDVQLNETQGKLLQWASRTSQLIGKAFDECSGRFVPSSFRSDRECMVLWQLIGSCHATSESSLLLIGNVRLWDADVLIRSIIEGTVKFVFLTLGSDDERSVKLSEFDDALGMINRIRRHQRLEDFLSVIGNPEADEWRPFRDMLLPEEELKALVNRYPKTVRQQLNQKWSFAEISSVLRRTGPPEYGLFAHMLYNYGMSSHIAHQDIDGIGMVWDRNGRSEVRRNAVSLAHGGRLISDIMIMSLLRTRALFKLLTLDTSVLNPLFDEYRAIQAETQAAGEQFHQIEYCADGVEE